MRGKKFSIGLKAVAIFAVTLLVTSTWAATNWHEKVLHSFNGTDGWSPEAGLIFDAAGNLYGTTEYGGTGGNCGAYGCGTVFELTPNGSGGWTETVLYSFCPQTGCTDGANPAAGLIFDAAGNLYGTTEYAGAYNSGTVFELTPNGSGGWTETVLYSFCSQANCTDGYGPLAGLIFDASGNLYGTTRDGGAYGYGTVFELTPTGGGAWTERVLHGFGKGTDGAGPSYYGKLIFDAAGNLYGMTLSGGAYGFGTAFELTPTAGGGWTEQVLYSFNNNGADGISPFAGLTFDAAGNLYGTTWEGGIYSCGGAGSACGTVFELSPVYSCAKCSHTADRELNVFPAERRDVLEQGGIERQ